MLVITNLGREIRRDSVKMIYRNNGADIHIKTLNWGPLNLTCYNGDFNIVKTLVTIGVYINQRNWHGKTTLIYSVKNSYPDIVKFLLDKEADNTILDYRGKTAFDYENYDKEMIIIFNHHKCKKGLLKIHYKRI